MTNVSTPIKIAVSLLAVAALAATSASFNKGASNGKQKKTTGPILKGSKKLQTVSPGGFVTGFGTGGGSVTGTGEAKNTDANGISSAVGSGNFTSSGGASGFLITTFGTANGAGKGGASGSQLGSALAMTGVVKVSVTGTSMGNGKEGFGASLSPMQFYNTTAIDQGTVTPGGSGKNGTAAVTESTTTTVAPVSTGPNGGYGFGLGSLDISSASTGSFMGVNTEGVGSSVGSVTNFGVGIADATGGSGSGSGSGTATGGGATKLDMVDGIFNGAGATVANFANQGSGMFGNHGTFTFP